MTSEPDEVAPLDLDQLMARAEGAPEPWRRDIRELVAMVRSLSADLTDAERRVDQG